MTNEENALRYFKDLRARKIKDYSSVFNIAPKDSVVYRAVSTEIEIYDTIIKTLEQQLSEDCISRQAVHRQINEWVASGNSDKNLLSLHNRVDTLPPTILQPKLSNKSTLNAIPIPDEATNGDMIKAMFNPYKICEYEYNVHIYMTEEDFLKADYQMNYNANWWNAPYNRSEE